MNDTARKAAPAANESQAEPLKTKKAFVEPEVSGPDDVLEAVSFFITGTTDPVVP